MAGDAETTLSKETKRPANEISSIEGEERRNAQLEYLVHEGVISPLEASKLSLLSLWSQSYEFQCVYEDANYIAVGKPFDVRIDLPTKGSSMGRKWPTELTVADWFVARCPDGESTGAQKVRFANQLDYATSGVMLLSKNKDAGAKVGRVFQQRGVEKEYAALVYGWPTWESRHIHARLQDIPGDFKRTVVTGDDEKEGQHAYTEVHVEMKGMLEFPDILERTDVSLLRIKLHTGRRHQIRLHLAHVGHPIVGDVSYGPEKAKESPRMFLHAQVLGVPVEPPFRIEHPSNFRELVRPITPE
eukprot:GEMP01061716.1.p1 GENE.GEMP01061716.1~~GEMP01061716.1.p1  ORF type:complete len:301 (-),score=58.66 GEMP01061716.1:405-1307(-)